MWFSTGNSSRPCQVRLMDQPHMASASSPFRSLRMIGDNKHDMEVYIKDLIDYCVMQNWYDPAKETDAAKWIKPDKLMACP